MNSRKIFKITIWHVVIAVWIVALVTYYVNKEVMNVLVFLIVAILAVVMVVQTINDSKNGN